MVIECCLVFWRSDARSNEDKLFAGSCWRADNTLECSRLASEKGSKNNLRWNRIKKNGWSILATAFRLGLYSLVEAQTKNKLRKNTFVFCLYSSVTRRYMQGVIYHVFGPRLSVQLIKLKETLSHYMCIQYMYVCEHWKQQNIMSMHNIR